MVGTAFQVEIDDDEVSKRLALLQKSLSDLTPAMKAIGGVVVKSVDLSFRTETDPYGTPWADLSEQTVLARLHRIAGKRKGESLGVRTEKGHTRANVVRAIASGKAYQILRDTGILANSITKKKIAVSADRDSVAVGTNIIYAATHQFGDDTRNIPARPFLPLEEKGLPGSLQDAIVDITNKFIEKSLGRG